MTFERLLPAKGSMHSITGSTRALNDISMNSVIAVGFGSAGYSKDGKELWSENQSDGSSYPTVQTVEDLAKKDPDHDWRIYYNGPMWEAEYQRQGEGIWVLIREGEGFA